MALIDFFKQSKKSKSAAQARERLQILVAHDRVSGGPSYLPQLQRDLLEVIRRYVSVDSKAVSVAVEHGKNQDILELNIVLPEK